MCYSPLIFTNNCFLYSLKWTLINTKECSYFKEVNFNNIKLVFKNISFNALAVFIKFIFIARTCKRATTTIVS